MQKSEFILSDKKIISCDSLEPSMDDRGHIFDAPIAVFSRKMKNSIDEEKLTNSRSSRLEKYDNYARVFDP